MDMCVSDSSGLPGAAADAAALARAAPVTRNSNSAATHGRVVYILSIVELSSTTHMEIQKRTLTGESGVWFEGLVRVWGLGPSRAA